MKLSLPLLPEQVDHAGRVHQALPQWRLADATLDMLATRLPGFTAEACLLKTVAVNAIYGTQLLATTRMANHINAVLRDAGNGKSDLGLVEQIARLPARQGEKPRLLVSFASKFCHFFISTETFPMYDEAARDALKLHLGAAGYVVDQANPYVAFCKNLDRLRELADLECTIKQLDRYLWLTGMFLRWQKEKLKKNPRVNAELKAALEQSRPEIVGELKAMLPAHLAAMVDS